MGRGMPRREPAGLGGLEIPQHRLFQAGAMPSIPQHRLFQAGAMGRGMPRREPAGLLIPQHRLFRPVRWAGGCPAVNRRGWEDWGFPSTGSSRPVRWAGGCPAVNRRGCSSPSTGSFRPVRWAGGCPAVNRRGWAHPPAPALPGRCWTAPPPAPALQAGAMGRRMPRREPAGLGSSPSTGSSRPARWAGGLPRREPAGLGSSPSTGSSRPVRWAGGCPAVNRRGWEDWGFPSTGSSGQCWTALPPAPALQAGAGPPRPQHRLFRPVLDHRGR